MRKYISIMILIALCGCGMKKESNRQHAAEVKKEIRWTDSLKREQIVVGMGNRKLKIHHIEWLPPDSAGQQYVKSVTGVTAEEEQKVEATIVETVDSEKEEKQETTIRTEEKQKQQRQNRILPWGVLVIILILFMISCQRRK